MTFLVQYVPVHLAGGQVGVFVQILVDKALVVAQIQIGLSAIVGHEHLTVLQRAHGAGIHIHIGVQLLAGHLQTAALEQTAQRCGCDALAKAGDDTAGDKDEFGLFLCHRISSSIFAFLIFSLINLCKFFQVNGLALSLSQNEPVKARILFPIQYYTPMSS